MMQAEAKKALRQQILNQRKNLSLSTAALGSHSISQQISLLPSFQRAGIIMGYLAMPGEPQLDALLVAAIEAGKTVCVPLMGSVYGSMEAAAITGFDELIAGRLGVRMPDPSRAHIVNPSLIDVVLTPGVAFDASGGRLGMGAGYYDRFFVNAPQATRVGIAWTMQLVDQVPQAEHDILMQWLVTEDKIICCNAQNHDVPQ